MHALCMMYTTVNFFSVTPAHFMQFKSEWCTQYNKYSNRTVIAQVWFMGIHALVYCLCNAEIAYANLLEMCFGVT